MARSEYKMPENWGAYDVMHLIWEYGLDGHEIEAQTGMKCMWDSDEDESFCTLEIGDREFAIQVIVKEVKNGEWVE